MTAGPQGQAIAKLIAILRASTVFQSRAGITDPARLEQEKIHCPCLEDKEEDALGHGINYQRPAAIIELPEDALAWETIAGGGRNYLMPRGKLQLTIEDLDQHPGNYNAGLLDFLEFAEGLVLAIVEAAALDDALAVQEIRQSVSPKLAETDVEAKFWFATYEISWGNIA